MIDKSQVDKELYKKLMIDLREPVELETKKGFVKFPVSGARVNAFVCAWCGKTPYTDPLGDDIDEIPLILYLEKGERGSVEFHFECAKEVLGLNV